MRNMPVAKPKTSAFHLGSNGGVHFVLVFYRVRLHLWRVFLVEPGEIMLLMEASGRHSRLHTYCLSGHLSIYKHGPLPDKNKKAKLSMAAFVSLCNCSRPHTSQGNYRIEYFSVSLFVKTYTIIIARTTMDFKCLSTFNANSNMVSIHARWWISKTWKSG